MDHLRLYGELGLLFLAALVGAAIARRLHLPKVTGYLGVGLLLGPSVLNVITTQDIATFRFLSELALGLFMVTVGTAFLAERFRRFERSLLWILFGEVALTFFLVAFCPFVAGIPLQGCLVLGAIAIATAPGATLIVLQQYRSEGNLTDHIMALVGLNVAISITLFQLIHEILLLMEKQPQTGWARAASLAQPLWAILGAILVGGGLGFLLAWLHSNVRRPEQVGMALAFLLLILGAGHFLNIAYPLAALAMGVVLVNSSAAGEELLSRLSGGVAHQVFALFFVVVGCDLHIKYLWKGSPTVPDPKRLVLLVLLYVMARTVGKVVGATWGARVGGSTDEVRKWIGWAILPHAGCALTLSTMVKEWPGTWGPVTADVVFTAVVIFEVVAPILVKRAVMSSGEVLAVNLIDHVPGEVPTWRNALDNLLSAVGYEPWRRVRSDANLEAAHIMRQVPITLRPDTHLRQILEHVENRRYNVFPVVNEDGSLEGVVSYKDLRTIQFDPLLQDAIIARDLMSADVPVLMPNTPLSTAFAIFEFAEVDDLPVVADDGTNRFLGLVLHGDLLHVLHVTSHKHVGDSELGDE